jgi:hypothetical protein
MLARHIWDLADVANQIESAVALALSEGVSSHIGSNITTHIRDLVINQIAA